MSQVNSAFPDFRYVEPTTDRRGRNVPAKSWRMLNNSAKTFVNFSAEPPLQKWEHGIDAFTHPGELQSYGPKRLGLERWTVAGKGLDTPWRMALPQQWRPDDFEVAYRLAWRIIRGVGFRHRAQAAWLYKDKDKLWWILDEENGALIEPKDDVNAPIFRLSMSDASPIGLLNDGGGSKIQRTPDLTDVFIEDFGGIFGPLHWAFTVVEAGHLRLSAVRNVRRLRQQSQQIVERPEWKTLRSAINEEWPDGGGLRQVIADIEHDLSNGPISKLMSAYIIGFRQGATLASLRAGSAIDKSEKARRVKGNAELKTYLKEIINSERVIGRTIQPYVLAKLLKSEKGTDRAEKLQKLGCPGVERLGVLISEIVTSLENDGSVET